MFWSKVDAWRTSVRIRHLRGGTVARIQSEQRGAFESEEESETEKRRKRRSGDRERDRQDEKTRHGEELMEKEMQTVCILRAEDRRGIEMLCLWKIYSLLNYFQQKLRLRLGGSRILSARIKKGWNRSNLGLLPCSLISLNIIEPAEG